MGFYTLVVGQVEYADAPMRPVPIMLLARLATREIAKEMESKSGLLKDAMMRTLQAADIAGIRAFAVHAKDERERTFYEQFDLIPSPTDPHHLFVLLKHLRRALGK